MSFLALPALAQMTVEEFEHRSNDLSNKTQGTMVRDANGDPAALIKFKAPTIENFRFDGGTRGIVTTKVEGNEIWIYVPASGIKLNISHPTFGDFSYEYPFALDKGETYSMLVNVGGGRFVNITSSGTNEVPITIDGKEVGKTPLYNHYLPFGTYQLAGRKERFEGKAELRVVEGEGKQNFSLQMIDQTIYFGEVVLTVKDDPNAEIWFENARRGAGTWRTELREGATYRVITKKANCDDAETSFTVKAQQTNRITVNAPVPHTGSIQLHTVPRSATVTYDNNQPFNMNEAQVLTVGRHLFTATRKDYNKFEKEINILKGGLVSDTLVLEPINYVKNKYAFYLGAGYSLNIGSLSGVSIYLGGVYSHFDLQLSYTLGLGSSDPAYWYNLNGGNHELLSSNTYKMSSFGGRLGYQILLIPRMSITPQVGLSYQTIQGSLDKGFANNTVYADGAKAMNLTLGAKLIGVPSQFVYLFLTPEYAVPVSKDATFEKAADAAGFAAGGLSISAGIIINIGK